MAVPCPWMARLPETPTNSRWHASITIKAEEQELKHWPAPESTKNVVYVETGTQARHRHSTLLDAAEDFATSPSFLLGAAAFLSLFLSRSIFGTGIRLDGTVGGYSTEWLVSL
jgi:hypothetical protein